MSLPTTILDGLSPVRRPRPLPTPEEGSAFASYIHELTLRFHLRAVGVIVLSVLVWWPMDSVVFSDPTTIALFGDMRVFLLGSCALSFAAMLATTRAGLIERFGLWSEVAFLLVIVGVMGYFLGQLPDGSGIQYLHWMPLVAIPFPIELRRRIALLAADFSVLWAAVLVGSGSAFATLWAPMSFSLGVCVVALVMGHWLYRLIETNFVTSRRLEQLSSELEERVRSQSGDLAALAQHAMEVRDLERAWLSRELHDALGQELTAVNYMTAFAKGRARAAEAGQGKWSHVSGAVDQLEQLVARTRRSIRTILSQMRPDALETMGPADALRWLAENLERHSQVTASFEVDEPLPDFDSRTWEALYRVLQEALTNVSRHAEATQVDLALRNRPDHWEMWIRDNGRGMAGADDVGDESPSPVRLGLVGMRERVALLGGVVRWESRPGRGVEVTVEIPYPAMELAS